MNEAETKATYIDPVLKKAGWGVIEGSRIRMEFPITKGRLIGNGLRSRPDKADYVLQFKNRNLAIIEAKASDKHFTEGVSQAKDYAKRLKVRFTYSTNGHQIYAIDMHEGKEGEVAAYPSPDELWAKTFEKDIVKDPEIVLWRDTLLSVPFEDRSGTWQPRYYQDNAVTQTLEAVAEGKDRILLTLATGTGKTAIAFQISWKLFHSKWNLNKDGSRSPRILFLADRNILADQAFNAFSAFEEDALVRISPDEIRRKKRVPRNGNIFFTIFQTFMSGPHETPYFGEYPRDFFDFIIIDECHRGGANDESTWRAILEYFSPAVQLGLTATPKRNHNIDTYRYFGEPVYVYSLKEGINDGFLTPFKVKEISTTGDEYIYSPDDAVLSGEIDERKVYGIEDQNRIIELMDIEQYRVGVFMKLIDQRQKTLVFCASQLHALAIRNLINQIADSTNPNYCQRVTADEGKLGEQYLRDFQDNEKSIPTILTTSHKLSTGVDAPEVRNIVLMRPVHDLVEFKQIIGRGTRIYENKDYFTIYDFVKAYHHFSDPEWDGEPVEPVPPDPRPPKVCEICGQWPCICEKPPPDPCPVCGYDPCRCDETPRGMIKVKLSDSKVMELQHMVRTSFWSPEGKPISAAEFLQTLFGSLPEFFKDEEELRKIWSRPDTRRKLMDELNEKGYTKSQLRDLQRMIRAENSDLYDVLAYISFNSKPIDRKARAERARVHFGSYDAKQQEFLNFVLDQYISIGVDELDDTKLPDLLELKYQAIADARQQLGDIASIRNTFIGFQPFLYEKVAI